MCPYQDVWIFDNSEIPEEPPSGCNHIITEGKKLGFAKAVNIGLKELTKQGYDFVIILNQDAYFAERHFDLFVETILSYPDHFICPLLFKEEFTEVIPFVKERYFKAGIPSSKKEIQDYVGVVIAGKLDHFNSLNGFDEDFFMYFEENDLFKRSHRHYPIVLDPHVHVAHRNKTSHMGKEELQWFYKSELHYSKKHDRKWNYYWLKAKGIARRLLKS